MTDIQKPIIGFSCGDLNGIGLEIILKSLADNRLLEMCTPVIFASNKTVNFYRKSLPDNNFQYQSIREFSKLNPKMLNIFNCWEEEVLITPGQLNETGGMYGRLSLVAATDALKAGHIHALVTAPIHKNNIQSDDFQHTGHTPFLKEAFGVPEVVMLMVADNMKVALLSEHVPLKDAAQQVTRENIFKKLQVLVPVLQKDFGIDKPKIAVLGLNPHAGDDGLVGKEEEEIIKPAIKDAKQKGMMVFGPYPADGFFARGHYEHFDAILAMYHDQGLIPFKSLALGEGVNYTAGLPAVRTSPDHGTAFDIAGKGEADHSSFLAAIFKAIDILVSRGQFADLRSNPMRRMSQRMVANAVDERIEEE
ncbi:MAG: 4-hydroxythreonine-4-phosphate dehydrogenase PdxA [Bacteroidetes bacterium]|uniref:4-hydroxythreonine-4-phosphate dehydrogenase PdxA n=1 Tax=Phnomibacter sp. TaxID=2836217 RepID=UPI002FDDF157|nr:4-hydroxythreonine-4-phosphate dehydrogenase PdxA [Bacteroidota bacterium]